MQRPIRSVSNTDRPLSVLLTDRSADRSVSLRLLARRGHHPTSHTHMRACTPRMGAYLAAIPVIHKAGHEPMPFEAGHEPTLFVCIMLGIPRTGRAAPLS
jgi:hypothetical protein